MNRRTFLTTTGAAVAAGAANLPSTSLAASTSSFPLSLPDLAYAAEALEPHIDAMTMNIHHGKHHAAYVANLNKALEGANVVATDALVLLKGLSGLPADIQTAVRNNGGGHVNHSLFWKWLTPADKSGKPDKDLAAAIDATFGSLDDLKKAVNEAGAKRFGSGWAWLIVKEDGKLAVTSTPNQDNPWMKEFVPEAEQGTPILGVDVWEHAYYLKYQNKRPDYLSAFWNVVNWDEVSKGYAEALKQKK
jgi:Fe-Mn family superoxide dismutase